MIVDDEIEVLDTLERYIDNANLGFHVVAKALNAAEALVFLDIATPDVIITDIKMPVIDGISMIQQMHGRGWDGYAILISGHDDFQYAQRAIRLNVQDYLLKPIFPDSIASTLKNIRKSSRKTTSNSPFPSHGDQAPGREPLDEDATLPDYIMTAKQYIIDHYDQPVTLVEVAEHAAVSPGYLSAQFPKYCRMSFVEYLTRVRLEEAKRLLAQTSLQIQIVVEMVGYNDVSYFNRVFRREIGKSPGNYRKTLRSMARRRHKRQSQSPQ